MYSYHIYTDGSSLGNPGRGGASAVFIKEVDGKKVHQFSRVYSEKNTTNNRMELMGMIMAVEIVVELDLKTSIYTDSNYVLKGLTEWSAGWVKRKWIKSDGKPVLNSDLWKQLISLNDSTSKIQYKKVKAHSGDYFNDLSDLLAKQSALRM